MYEIFEGSFDVTCIVGRIIGKVDDLLDDYRLRFGKLVLLINVGNSPWSLSRRISVAALARCGGKSERARTQLLQWGSFRRKLMSSTDFASSLICFESWKTSRLTFQL